ncbi:MAG: hypothetical protein L0Z07_05275, partial [Planctomycetes bacterium]|nr:hypothetical protein [Planctomycetota bacterium]
MEPIDIVVHEVPANRRRQRGSGFGRFLMQLVFFLASLIPMCIIAWKLDVAGLMRPQPLQVAQRLDTKPERDRNPPEKSLPLQPRKSRIPQDWFQPPLPEDQQPRKEKPTS